MLKLGLSTIKIIDALSCFRQNILSTIKQLSDKKQAELKQQLKVVSFNKNRCTSFMSQVLKQQFQNSLKTIFAFVLHDNQLYLVRLERNAEPFLLKLVGFNQQYLEKFKLIIREYYASVNEDKFWNFGKFT